MNATAPLITWAPYFATGLAEVDAQHQGLVSLLNQAASRLAGQTALAPEEAAPLLDALTEYAAVHFNTEDALMADAGIDPRHLQHHRAQHQDFVTQLNAMRAAYARGGPVSGEALLHFLASWLTFHILGEDQVMARQMHALARGVSAESAYLAAGQANPADPAQQALVDALVELFNLLSQQNQALNTAHADISQYRDHLEDLVRQRAAELERANHALRDSLAAAEAANHAKSRFLRTISHELLTPLNAISGFTHLLLHADLPAKAHDHAEKIQTAARTLNAQIQDVITYATLDAGGIEARHTPFGPAILFAHLISRHAARAAAKGLQLRSEISADLPVVLMGDSAHLEMALEHYLRNAIAFTEHGTITLRADLMGMAQTGCTDNCILRARFGVHDTGPGVAESLQPRLFQAFEQGDMGLTRRGGGMGLGLAIVGSLAHLMHGVAGMHSTPGIGSQFWLEVPVRPVQTACDSNEGKSTDLPTLRALLQADDLGARAAFAQLNPDARARLGPLHVTLAAQLGRFDFAGALDTLNALPDKKPFEAPRS